MSLSWESPIISSGKLTLLETVANWWVFVLNYKISQENRYFSRVPTNINEGCNL